ncbi:MAG: phospholipase [Flavobacteriaceae bacterium]|nr:phospholipase [Flavobacteriaceae bacterium]
MSAKQLPLHAKIRPSLIKKNAPLLVLLHGYGSDESDLFSFADELPNELFILSLRAPHKLQPYGNAWYAINFDAQQNKWNDIEQAQEAMKIIISCIEQACTQYDLDKNNVSLLGFSQGCILSMALAINHPELIKNVIGLSGYLCEEFIDEDRTKKDFSHLDFYCSHGSSDQVIPVDWARETPNFLTEKGIKHTYSEFPVGHGVAPQNFFEFRKWLIERV